MTIRRRWRPQGAGRFVFARISIQLRSGAAGLNLTRGQQEHLPGDYDNIMPRVGRVATFRAEKLCGARRPRRVLRATTGFATRPTAPPFSRAAAEHLGDGTSFGDRPALRFHSSGSRSTTPNPSSSESNIRTEFEALETQMVSPDLETPPCSSERQHAVGVRNTCARRGGTSAARETPPSVHQPEPGVRLDSRSAASCLGRASGRRFTATTTTPTR